MFEISFWLMISSSVFFIEAFLLNIKSKSLKDITSFMILGFFIHSVCIAVADISLAYTIFVFILSVTLLIFKIFKIKSLSNAA